MTDMGTSEPSKISKKQRTPRPKTRICNHPSCTEIIPNDVGKWKCFTHWLEWVSTKTPKFDILHPDDSDLEDYSSP